LQKPCQKERQKKLLYLYLRNIIWILLEEILLAQIGFLMNSKGETYSDAMNRFVANVATHEFCYVFDALMEIYFQGVSGKNGNGGTTH
jgi:hypothetical protein